MKEKISKYLKKAEESKYTFIAMIIIGIALFSVSFYSIFVIDFALMIVTNIILGGLLVTLGALRLWKR